MTVTWATTARIRSMRITGILLRIALGVALVAPMSAQKPPEGDPGEVLVRIETSFGSIDVAVDGKHAPITAANFLKYVDGKFYDGGRFHRATRPDNYTPQLPDRSPFQIVQADINPERSKDKFPPIALERTTATGLSHKEGTLSMPRGAAAD